ncbi:MAG: MBL fold metallo-hydrolase [Parcubacteria group bacterium CG_4_9_14_0_2_um_filter_41_8]|nr:MAG: hydrolase [Parcubacteria group bacterium CG11_big_fil_rev_8_21_14_0_20_41_14]PJC41098.1 MAG: MBL fold metallo-hydrolase [Parcubacteria group bacterium CG_4_9_14_0_2_um_filter_41_8]
MLLKHLKRIIILISGATVLSCVLTVVLFFNIHARSGSAEIIFLDVGQGDSILIKTRYGQNILIDGGKDNRVLDRLGRNLSFFDHKLDMVIATHPDADHIGGLVSVLERYDVDLFLDPGIVHDSSMYEAMWSIINSKKIPVNYVSQRQIYEFGDNVILDVLYPNIDFVGKDIEDNNLASIVAKFSDNKIDAMLTGDAHIETENELVALYGSYLESEILKAGHHGSDTSSSEEFLDTVKPEVAILSVGADNSYGHPKPRTINRLKARLITILRTDETGDIRLVSDGEYVELR